VLLLVGSSSTRTSGGRRSDGGQHFWGDAELDCIWSVVLITQSESNVSICHADLCRVGSRAYTPLIQKSIADFLIIIIASLFAFYLELRRLVSFIVRVLVWVNINLSRMHEARAQK
jgi:hypothetical protein